MTPSPRVAHRVARGALGAAYLGLVLAGGCRGEDPLRLEPPSTDVDPALARQSEEGLHRFGEGRFTVESFTPVSSRRIGLTEYFYETRLLAVAFDARITFTREVVVRSAEESMARQGQQGWTREETLDDVLCRNVLGEGRHPAGESRDLHAAAFFDELEPGHRFRLVDKRFEPHDTHLQRGSGSR